MEFAFVVIAVAALAQCGALLMAHSNARFWRKRYFEASRERDDVIAKWNKTIADYNRFIDDSKAFREHLQRHLSVVE